MSTSDTSAPDGSTSDSWWPSRLTLAVLVPAALVTVVAILLLWPGDHATPEQPEDGQRVNGTITAIDEQPCSETPEDGEPSSEGEPDAPDGAPGKCGSASVVLTDGPEVSTTITAELPNGPGAPTVAEGDDVVLMYLPDSPDGQAYQIIDHQRGTQLWIIVAAFAFAVIAFGRLRGMTALAGLAVTFGVLLFFVVPAILDGKSPLLVAIAGSAAIMLTVLYLTHGFATSTSVAVAGTLAALTLTGVLSAAAVGATHLSGIADEESSYLGMMHHVDMQGLLLAGILIGSLGVLDDVTVTQAATVTELARANPGYGFRQLYRAATRVGRAHIASVINTIILAYAGASLPLLILISAGSQPIGQIMTNQLIAQELIRSAVGTIGLIAAVPITTALAALTTRQPASAATNDDDPGASTSPRHSRARTRETSYVAALSRDPYDTADRTGHRLAPRARLRRGRG